LWSWGEGATHRDEAEPWVEFEGEEEVREEVEGVHVVGAAGAAADHTGDGRRRLRVWGRDTGARLKCESRRIDRFARNHIILTP